MSLHQSCYLFIYATGVDVLTKHDQQKDEAGHSGCDVEHDADVLGQFIHVIHVGHKNRRDQETNGNAKLKGKDIKTQLHHNLSLADLKLT